MHILYHMYSVFLGVLMNNALFFFPCHYSDYGCNNTVRHFNNTYACHISVI